MAKGKHSAALFEVITRSKPISPAYRQGFFARLASRFRPAPGLPNSSYSADSSDEMATPLMGSAPAPRRIVTPPIDAPLGDADTSGIEVDLARRQIGLRFSYTTIAIGVIALVTALTVAFLVGKKLGAPRPALADKTIDERRAQAVEAGVLEIDSHQDDNATGLVASVAGGRDSSSGQSPAPRTRSREVGKNYIIVQSYPDRKTAEKAVTVLVQNGVDCSAEKSPSGWSNKSWWTVITLDGYDRISDNRTYDTQIKKIKDISDKFAKRNSFNAFDPTAYKWRAADAQ